MAKFSRSKGSRVERDLVNFLKLQGIPAVRIPLSGASQGFKGDVRFTYKGKERLAEVKARATDFDKVYEMYNAHLAKHGDVMYLCIDGQLIQIAGTIDGAYSAADAVFEIPRPKTRTHSKLIRMREWLGEAEVLVIKGDRKAFLFLRYK